MDERVKVEVSKKVKKGKIPLFYFFTGSMLENIKHFTPLNMGEILNYFSPSFDSV